MLAEAYYSEKCNPETNGVVVTDNRPTDENLASGTYILQPKLDGVRCIASKDGFFTRQGEKLEAVPHIEKELLDFFKIYDVTLDGELYLHNVDFNDLNGTIRREVQNDTKEQSILRSKIKYFVYDIVSDDCYEDRFKALASIAPQLPNKVYNLIGAVVHSRKEIDLKHDAFVLAGYEGAVLRNIKAAYQQGKRTKDLLKVKKFTDAEFTITDILEGKGNHSGLATKIEIEDNGVKVYPSMTGEAEFKQRVLENKHLYIGGQATIKFFGRTSDGSLRHPSVKALYKGKRDI